MTPCPEKEKNQVANIKMSKKSKIRVTLCLPKFNDNEAGQLQEHE
jgi:hypothetical protein